MHPVMLEGDTVRMTLLQKQKTQPPQDTIDKLELGTGKSISRIEAELIEVGKFLSPDESLTEILIADTESVQAFGLTHADISEPLQRAIDSYMPGIDEDFVWNGISYSRTVLHSRGFVYSPFDRNYKSSRDMILTREGTSTTLRYSFLAPHLIRDFHFYQGKNSPYRLDPEKIISFFDLVAAPVDS